jgi:hypothetical protein
MSNKREKDESGDIRSRKKRKVKYIRKDTDEKKGVSFGSVKFRDTQRHP